MLSIGIIHIVHQHWLCDRDHLTLFKIGQIYLLATKFCSLIDFCCIGENCLSGLITLFTHQHHTKRLTLRSSLGTELFASNLKMLSEGQNTYILNICIPSLDSGYRPRLRTRWRTGHRSDTCNTKTSLVKNFPGQFTQVQLGNSTK